LFFADKNYLIKTAQALRINVDRLFQQAVELRIVTHSTTPESQAEIKFFSANLGFGMSEPLAFLRYSFLSSAGIDIQAS
jgi:hypothetical protein